MVIETGPGMRDAVIHTVAMNVPVLYDDVAEVDADAKYDPLVLGNRDVALGHPTLHGDRTGHGLNDARELDQNAVAGRLDDATLVVGDLRVDQLAAMDTQPCQRPRLILAHQAAVAGEPLSVKSARSRRRPKFGLRRSGFSGSARLRRSAAAKRSAADDRQVREIEHDASGERRGVKAGGVVNRARKRPPAGEGAKGRPVYREAA